MYVCVYVELETTTRQQPLDSPPTGVDSMVGTQGHGGRVLVEGGKVLATTAYEILHRWCAKNEESEPYIWP